MKKRGILEKFTLVISIILAMFSLGVLGKDEWVITQIATIFFPMLFSLTFTVSAVILLSYLYKLYTSKWDLKSLSRIGILTLSLALISFGATSVEYISYRNAFVSNGAKSVGIFSSFSAMAKMSTPDEQVVYASKEGEDLTISIYNPKHTDQELRPVYVYVHGGGWGSGDAESNSNYHQMMKDEGYVSFSINYRLAKPNRPTWDKQIEDVNDAMKWIYENAKNYGGDSERIFLAGESAGGNLALVYGGQVSQGLIDGPVPKALTVIFPAIDMKWTSENARFMTSSVIEGIVETYIGGHLEDYPNRVSFIDPRTYINDKLPPTLIIHGLKDTMVTVNGSRDYIEKINKLGIKNQLAEIPYSNHGTSIQGNFEITMNFLKEIPNMTIKHDK